jgi:regulator of nonsense transcripts 3
LGKENIPSRAYIAFKNEEQLALFSREYDGHVFRDKSGLPFPSVSIASGEHVIRE